VVSTRRLQGKGRGEGDRVKIIKVNNCGECQYIDTTGYPENYKYCRYRYIKTGEIKKIENKEIIADWCDLEDYKEYICLP